MAAVQQFLIPGSAPIVSVQSLPRRGRRPRNPRHPFRLRTRPWQIQPFLLAPVLPGETLENLLLQSRVVSDPLTDKLGGWFKEYYFFYCKLTDLDDHASMTAMLVTNASTAGLATAADPAYFYRGDGINFSKKCLERIVDEYFRDDGEAFAVAAIDNMPLAAIDVSDGYQSLILDSATNVVDDELPGEAPGLPPHMSAFADHFAHWEAMRDMGLVAVTFEDWLEMMGVKADAQYKEETRRPELIRYIRQWTYPSNTVDPSNGVPTSAATWSVAERADKARFFKEPGFLVGVTVTRPKVYRRKAESALGNYADMPYAWLPAILQNDPYTSLRKWSDTAGPLAGVMTAAYWLDMNDLYQRGDQFVNYSLTGVTDVNAVDLPSVAAEVDYASATDADALFSNPGGGFKYVREDGVCNLRIMSAHSTEDTSL